MNIFLKAKHWHLFFLTAGLSIILQIVMMIAMENSDNPFIMFEFVNWTPVLVFIFIAVLMGWIWAIGVGLHTQLPTVVTLSVSRFKAAFIFLLVVLLLFFGVGIFIMTGSYNLPTMPDPELFLYTIPLILLAVFCLLYCLRFVAITFKAVELQRAIYIPDFAITFMLMLLFPIGIWVIQPKVNQMVEEETVSVV